MEIEIVCIVVVIISSCGPAEVIGVVVVGICFLRTLLVRRILGKVLLELLWVLLEIIGHSIVEIWRKIIVLILISIISIHSHVLKYSVRAKDVAKYCWKARKHVIWDIVVVKIIIIELVLVLIVSIHYFCGLRERLIYIGKLGSEAIY
jgi:hypothetical protein